MKEMRTLFQLLAVFLLISAFPAVNAVSQTTNNYSPTLNLSSGVFGDGAFTISFSAPPNFNLQTGDVISGTIYFANDQSLEVKDPTGSQFQNIEVNFTSPAGGEDNFTFDLMGVTGYLSPMYNGDGYGESTGLNIVGVTQTDAGGFTFDGFTYCMTLTSDATDVTPEQFVIYSATQDISIITTPVPEPPVLALTTLSAAVFLIRRWSMSR
jgi:hypothetical protein